MSYPQQPYAQPQQPAPKSNKTLWIVLGIIIGVPVILMGGCAACVVVAGLIGSQNQNRPFDVTTPTPAVRTQPSPVAPATTSPASGVTMANFSRLKNGMPYEQVVGILGKEGMELSRNQIADIETVMYQWNGEGFGANMNAIFQQNKLMSKSQFGLK